MPRIKINIDDLLKKSFILLYEIKIRPITDTNPKFLLRQNIKLENK